MRALVFPIVVILLCGCSKSYDKYDAATDQVKRNTGSTKHRSPNNNKEKTVDTGNGGEITLTEGDDTPPGFVVTDDKNSGSGGVMSELKPAEPDKK